MMTRNGVVYDLRKSPYQYKEGETTYIFSSKNHRDKFKENLEENRISIENSLSKRFKIMIKFKILCDIVLYSKIESRGFLIIHEGIEITCLKQMLLSGEEKIIKS